MEFIAPYFVGGFRAEVSKIIKCLLLTINDENSEEETHLSFSYINLYRVERQEGADHEG
jgi:hypothetical protein